MRHHAGTALGVLALFVALSGASYAALALPKNSVTTKQVKDHSLLRRDFKNGQVPRGPAGPAGLDGLPGAQGPQGPPGPVNTSPWTAVFSGSVPVCASGSACDTVAVAAVCPTGTRVLGGGMFEFTGGTAGHFEGPSSDHTAWVVGVSNSSSYGGGDLQAQALCATTGAAVIARHGRMTESTRRDVSRVRARLAAMHP